MAASFRKPDQTGHQFSRMNHYMGFDAAFAPAVLSGSSGHLEDVFEQADDSRIDNKQLLDHFHLESAVRQNASVFFKKRKIERFEYLTWSSLIPVRDGGSAGSFGYPDMYQLVLPGQKTRGKLPERSGSAERTVQHRDKMLPGVKAFVVPIRLVFGNNFCNKAPIDQRKKLRKNRLSEEMCIFHPLLFEVVVNLKYSKKGRLLNRSLP